MTDLSPFNSFYELAAAITSAVAGFLTVQEFLTVRLERDADKVQQDIEQMITKLSAKIDQLIDLIQSSPATLRGDKAVVSRLTACSNDRDWCETQSNVLSSKHEKEVLGTWATALFFYAFLFYASLLIANGMASANMIGKQTSVAFAINLSLAAVVNMGILPLLLAFRWPKRSVMLCLCTFPLSVAVAVLFTIISRWEPSYWWAVGLTVAITLLPLAVMLSGRRVAWYRRKPAVINGLRERNARADETEAFLQTRLDALHKKGQ